jgi:hypothetical protein
VKVGIGTGGTGETQNTNEGGGQGGLLPWETRAAFWGRNGPAKECRRICSRRYKTRACMTQSMCSAMHATLCLFLHPFTFRARAHSNPILDAHTGELWSAWNQPSRSVTFGHPVYAHHAPFVEARQRKYGLGLQCLDAIYSVNR